MEYTIDKAEVRRYLGMSAPADEKTEKLIDECSRRLCEVVRPVYTYQTFRIVREDKEIRLDGCNITLTGELVLEKLKNCNSCALLGATLGAEADSIIRITQNTDMAKAVIYDACATDLIEKVCDRAESEICAEAEKDGLSITPRFSPGYGDLPLGMQRDICLVLDLGRRCGIWLTDELLLTPTKSVTAFVGIGNNIAAEARGCTDCNMRERCRYHKNALAEV